MSSRAGLWGAGAGAGWVAGVISALVASYFAFQWQSQSTCESVVSIIKHDVVAMVAFEERTRPLWDKEMKKLKNTGDPQAEGGRRWIMPNMRVDSLSVGFVVGDLGGLDDKIVEPVMQFYGLTQQLNSQIVQLSGEPIRSASEPEKTVAIKENEKTRSDWSRAAAELRDKLESYTCSFF